MLRNSFKCPGCGVSFDGSKRDIWLFCPKCAAPLNGPIEGGTVMVKRAGGVMWGVDNVQELHFIPQGRDKPTFKIDKTGKFFDLLDETERAMSKVCAICGGDHELKQTSVGPLCPQCIVTVIEKGNV